MVIQKEAKIVKRKNKWCVVGHRRDKGGKHRDFGCYDTKEEAKKRLGQIYMFKNKKAELMDIIIDVSDDLSNKGLIHIADVLAGCLETITTENSQGNAIKLGKIVNLLHKRGESESAEIIDAILPEILCFENCDCISDPIKSKNRMTADKVYKIATDLKSKYQVGLIDENSFEFAKMKEMESMLKTGFLLPPPLDCETLPTETKNWWEYFAKEKNNEP